MSDAPAPSVDPTEQPASDLTPLLPPWPSPDSDPARVDRLPMITADIPGIGGVIRKRPEDFLVDEQPLYEPCGEGEHIYLFVEKKGLSTAQLVSIIAHHFGVQYRAVGYAGMKDKHAITRQVVSVHVPGRKLEDFPMLQHDRVGVLWADMHTNKLRLGHLRGNRFSIRIREVAPTAVLQVHQIMKRLASQGIPNYFGEQRFGIRCNNHILGRLDLLRDARGLIYELLGPDENFPTIHAQARAAFAKGDYAGAYRAFPGSLRTERNAARAVMQGRKPSKVLWTIPRNDRQFWMSAFQSAVFNQVLAQRLTGLGLNTLVEGDLAYRHDNGAVFRVTAEELAKPETLERLHKLEISPSGPIWGSRTTRADGAIGEMEWQALAETGVPMAALEKAGRDYSALSGQRRPLRVPIRDPEVEGGVDEHGSFVRVAFDLPPGSFATVVLREIMKSGSSGARPVANGEEDEEVDGMEE